MKNKKKINIIDLIFILVLLAAVAVVGVSKFVLNDEAGANQKITITFYAEEVPESIAKSINIGDFITDNDTKVAFGQCADVVCEDSVSYIATKDYEYIKTSREGYNSLTVVCESIGKITDIGAVYDGKWIYGVGHTFTALIGDSRISCRVRNIEISEG